MSAWVEIAGLKAIEKPSAIEFARRAVRERALEIIVADKQVIRWALSALAVCGFYLGAYGFWRWHRDIQPMQDEIARLQLEKLRMEVCEMNRSSPMACHEIHPLRVPIVLRESTPIIGPLCRSVEHRLASISDVGGLNLAIDLLPNFDGVPEAAKSPRLKQTSAFYRPSIQTIFLNAPEFVSLPPGVQEAVLAHEIAHAVAKRDGLMEKTPAYQEFGPYGEEFLVDRLACKWGFFDGVRAERTASYGEAYVAALHKWEDEQAYIVAMHGWHLKKRAGIHG